MHTVPIQLSTFQFELPVRLLNVPLQTCVLVRARMRHARHVRHVRHVPVRPLLACPLARSPICAPVHAPMHPCTRPCLLVLPPLGAPFLVVIEIQHAVGDVPCLRVGLYNTAQAL